ncbi:MAG: MauE/DoxX family redox-associated membrane protein [Jatrophihabitantaceae bacterium]
MIIAALSAAAATLLVIAGIAKLRTPDPAATMLVGLRPRLGPLRRARTVARGAAVLELATGVAVLVAGGRIAATALLVCYLGLAAVALRLAVSGNHVRCGCFGAADGEVGAAHIALDLCGVVVAAAALAHPAGGIGALFAEGALRGSTVAAQAAVLAALGYLSITALPALSAARRSVEAGR